MAGPNYLLAKGFQASAGPINRFRFVSLGANELVAHPGTAGARVIGVVQEDGTVEDVTNGRVFNVWMKGISRMIAGGTFTIGDPVTTAADGRVIVAGVGNVVHGTALQSAVAGDHVDIDLDINGRVA